MRKQGRSKRRTDLPEILQIKGGAIPVRNGKIPLLEIFRSLESPGELVDAFRNRVLTQNTRTIRLLGKKNSAKIIHTLLGYEVQAVYKRIQCPDLVTARYLRLFSELGCHSIKLPYDPTLTARLIPEFEAMVEDVKAQIRGLFARNTTLQHYVLRKLYGMIREQLAASRPELVSARTVDFQL
jgi:hypothetical protein